eukprot:CAMPEP_0184022128 /NCGR_PEP_ID=MMETSP0954-20121128/10401_1 /TAXON_ID=627963 /ORGANISM="Aplanochytrium sp, Strain PBS07" /LENGTH=1212 /DNA_ID=CAMNT_0026304403 /DNA_START=201 /DNA_END=3839 /DNA_ORIENTATION=-
MAYGMAYGEDDTEGDNDAIVATVAGRGNNEYYAIPRKQELIVDSKTKYKVEEDPKKNSSAEEVRRALENADSSFQVNSSVPLLGVSWKVQREYCLVANAWARDLADFLNGTDGGRHPGPVVNDPLFDPNEKLTKLRKVDGRDYSVVSVPVWEVLMEHFGGGPEVKRFCEDKHGTKSMDGGVDIRAVCSKDASQVRRVNFPNKTTVQEMKKYLAELFEVEVEKTRLYDYFQDKPYARLDGKGSNAQPISKKNLIEDQLVLLECELEEGDYLIKRIPQTGGGSTYYNMNSNEDSIKGSAPEVLGAVGLQNIGNTCYMNSTMQCLSNIPQLRKFFVSDEYKAEINKDNPLSYDGKLAEAYGGIMQMLWSGEGDVVEPRGFKSVISDIKPEFAGYEQHDSQELLSYILDGLHEELNRIQNKPPTEKPVGNGRPDKDVAEESLNVYRLRNDSKISDLFTGLFKSTVTCPNPACNNVSVTFDPYMILQLPLQAEEELYHKLHIIYVNPGPNYSKSKPPVQKFNVVAPKHGPVFLLRRIIASHMNVAPNSVVLTQVSYSKITRKFTDDADLASISASNAIVAYQVENADKFLDSLSAPDLDWRRRLKFAPDRYDEHIEQAEEASSDGYASPEELQSLDDDLASKKSGKSGSESNQETGFEDFKDEDIGFPNCPWVVGDVWKGKYQFDDTEQLLRIEVLEVTKIDDNNFQVTSMFDTREDTFENIAKYKSHSAFRVQGTYTIKEKPAAFSTKKAAAKPKKKKSTMFGLRSKKADSLKAPEEKFENVEAKFVGGSITFKPVSQRHQIFKGEARSAYARGPYSRYGGFGDDSQEEAREPIITIGSVDTLHKFMWGKINNMLDFKKGEFFAERLESRAWETVVESEMGGSKGKKTAKQKTDVGPMTQIPEVKPQDERIAVMIAHRRKSPYATSSRFSTSMFMVPHVALLHQRTTEGQLYEYIGNQMKGWMDACGDSTPVEEVMDKVRIVRSTSKFETPSYALKSLERLCVGEEIEKDCDDNMMADPTSFFLYLLIDWDEEKCPFERAISNENLLVPNTSEVMNINSAVELFSREEKLSPMNAWYCPKCKDFQEALKKLEIWSLPPVLVVQFKRFSQREGRNRADKLETQVDFPVKDLDLGEYVLSDNPLDRSMYDLVGVSSHVGALGLGHYTAVARNAENGSWYSYNDSRVSKLTDKEAEDIADPSAYVVFYLRKDLTPDSFK